MTKKNFVSEYLSDESLDTISSEIQKIEKNTSGEIRVCIKRKLGFLEKKHTMRQVAVNHFTKLKMGNTIDRTGVLFLLVFEERKFEIIADQGINSKIPVPFWDEISGKLSDHFVQGNYLDGILHGLQSIGEILKKEFPARENDKDELSNEVIIES